MLSKFAVTVFVALVGLSGLAAAEHPCSSDKVLYCCPNTPTTNLCITPDNGQRTCVGGKFQCCVQDAQGGGPKPNTCTSIGFLPMKWK